MLRPLIVLQENNKHSEGPGRFRDIFLANGLFPIFCSFDTGELSSIRIKAGDLLLIAPHKDSDIFQRLCHYLKDIGLEEEKRIFLCGSGDAFERAKTILPVMLRKETMEIEMSEMEYVAHRIGQTIPARSKGVLIIDEDPVYIRNLMTALSSYCTVAVSDGSMEDTTPYINQVDLMIVSLDLKTDFLSMSKLFRIISKTKRERDYHLIFIVRDHARRKEVYSSLEENAVCLSKETDFVKNAAYIISRYLKESKTSAAVQRPVGTTELAGAGSPAGSAELAAIPRSGTSSGIVSRAGLSLDGSDRRYRSASLRTLQSGGFRGLGGYLSGA